MNGIFWVRVYKQNSLENEFTFIKRIKFMLCKINESYKTMWLILVAKEITKLKKIENLILSCFFKWIYLRTFRKPFSIN